jgi:hypothetical protein
MNSYLISLAAAFWFAAYSAHAESARLEVGDAGITGSQLKPCTNLWRLLEVPKDESGSGEVAAIITYTMV